MNAEDKFRLLNRFSAWLAEHNITHPISADVYRFLETNR